MTTKKNEGTEIEPASSGSCTGFAGRGDDWPDGAGSADYFP